MFRLFSDGYQKVRNYWGSTPSNNNEPEDNVKPEEEDKKIFLQRKNTLAPDAYNSIPGPKKRGFFCRPCCGREEKVERKRFSVF